MTDDLPSDVDEQREDEYRDEARAERRGHARWDDPDSDFWRDYRQRVRDAR